MWLREFVKLAVIVGVLSPVVVWALLNLKDYKDIAGISASHEALGDRAYSASDFSTAVAAYERARSSKESFHLLVKQTGAMIGMLGLHPEMLGRNQATRVDHDRKWLMVQDPSSTPTCIAVGGHLALRKGHRDRAEKAYRESLDEDPENLAAHYGLALLARRAGDADTAAKELEIVLESVPDHVDALVSLGEIRSKEEGKADKAIELFEKALAIEEDFRSRLGLGLVRLGAGDAREAELDLIRASQLNAKAIEPLQALGNLYLGIKAYPRAEQAFSAALKIGQTEDVARGLAITLREQSRVNEALRVLSPFLKSVEANPSTLLVAAQCLERARNVEQAGNLYSAVIDRVKKMGRQIPEKIGSDLTKASQAGLARLEMSPTSK